MRRRTIRFLVNNIFNGWMPDDTRLGGTVSICYHKLMKLIPLSKNKYAKVDDEDYKWLIKRNWWYNGKYAVSVEYEGKKRINVWMHREIMKTPKGLFTDHINMDRLDNRKENLRICTKSQNMHNRPAQSNNTSGHKNIYWDKARSKWTVEVKVQGKKYHIGRFNDIKEAIKRRNLAQKGLVGEFMRNDYSVPG